ncbi:hypothetical protein [Nocardioides exalbidus]|uniref:hypothetical protein n=1 Tax=Nocardioides exalbidus TaxID=402596 RepID=UPI0011153F52|nr:hypothetical protein [Nocardioides exalbidus]
MGDDLDDADQHGDPFGMRFGPMFAPGRPARSERATDLAIPVLHAGGWSGLTLRTMARAANTTPQAVAAWFPSVGRMRLAIAERYGKRWIRERGAAARRQLRAIDTDDECRVVQVARALATRNRAERAFDGIWLTIVEASRWDLAIRSVVAPVLARERDLVTGLLVELGEPEPSESDVELALALVRGQRFSVAAR